MTFSTRTRSPSCAWASGCLCQLNLEAVGVLAAPGRADAYRAVRLGFAGRRAGNDVLYRRLFHSWFSYFCRWALGVRYDPPVEA